MELMKYQTEISEAACALLQNFKIAYLVMEVRTGKTITAINAAKLYGARKVLFVTKLKAISSIQKDFEGIGKPFDLFCINYESLHKCGNDYDLVILDEAHCLSQYPTPAERIKELKRICVDLPIIYLSGTPSPESYSQFYHQFYVSSFSPFTEKKFYEWHKKYGIYAVKYLYNRQINDYSKTKTELVKQQIEHLLISFTQEQAGFTSFVDEEIIYLPMHEKIKWAINKLKKDKVVITKEGKEILGDTAVKEMNKIHQLCSGTVKCEDGTALVIDQSKAEYILNNFKGKKIAIFYKYIAESIALKWVFNDRIITDPMEFNKADKDGVFISQIQSGREGINLSTADCLIMYNIDFSAVSYWQARARLQTKNRTEAAKVYWLFTADGIENKIYNVVMQKKDFTTSHYKKIKN